MDTEYKHSRREFSHILKQRASPPPISGQVWGGGGLIAIGSASIQRFDLGYLVLSASLN